VSQATRGKEMASQARVRDEGVCAHPAGDEEEVLDEFLERRDDFLVVRSTSAVVLGSFSSYGGGDADLEGERVLERVARWFGVTGGARPAPLAATAAKEGGWEFELEERVDTILFVRLL